MRTFLLMSALVATPAFAGDGSTAPTVAERVHRIMARLDTDRDGRISRAEAEGKPRFSARFDHVDTNKDGYITSEELTAALEKRLKR